jgi:hypothetical protein
MTTAEVLNALRKVDRPQFPPGQKYQYSNSGYVLLGLIVERVSGQPLSDYLQEHIFKPLGMKSTFVLTTPSQKASAVARGYDTFGKPDDYDQYVTGDGGVYSTVDDLFALDQALYSEKLVKRQTLEEAFTPGQVREGQTTYGFGWNVASDTSGQRVWHTGNTAGFRAFFERRLDEKITVIMLTNGGDTDRVGINQAIQQILAVQPCTVPDTAPKTLTPDLKALADGKGGAIPADATLKWVEDVKGKPALKVQSKQDDTVLPLDGIELTNGVIEFDALGQSGPRGSNFVGIAFRVVDAKTHDAVYFRPFNFRAEEAERKAHAVQYISHPKYRWQVLRQDKPGQYEKPIVPALDGDAWFHARIVAEKPKVSVYVNNAKEPSLVVEELSDRKGGGVGLWVGPGQGGYLANLKITPAN